MAVKTGQETYLECSQLTPECYLYGKRMPEKIADGELNGVALSAASIWDLMGLPVLEGKAYKESSLIPGEKVNLWNDILTTPEEWMTKVRVQRKLTQRCICIFRCLGNDIMNGGYAAAWECDQKYGTNYKDRFVDWIKEVQKNDYGIAGAVIDAKGNRSLPIHEQKNKMTYVKIVDKKKDGIIVRGIKCNTTYGPVFQQMVVTPSRYDYTEKDKDAAVAFVVSPNTKGIRYICRPPGIKKPHPIEHPMSQRFGWVDTITVFEDVFVPNERVFLCGEWDMANRWTKNVLGSHMWAKGGCHAGTTDLFTGILKVISEYNGSDKYPHIRGRLIHMIHSAELAYNCALGSAIEGGKHPSGVWLPNFASATAAKLMALHDKGGEMDGVMEAAGGVIITGPSSEEFKNSDPKIREYLDQALSGSDKCTTEQRVRMLKLIEDLTCTETGGLMRELSLHAGGPFWMMEDFLYDHYDFEDRELTAKVWAGIEKVDKIGFGFPA